MGFGLPIKKLRHHLLRGTTLDDDSIPIEQVVSILERLGYIETSADKRTGRDKQFYKWLVSYDRRSSDSFKRDIVEIIAKELRGAKL